MTKDKILLEIKDLFTSKGNSEYFGEEVTQFEHAAQALQLAIKDNQDLEMQTAAFLHDIGHLVSDISIKKISSFGNKDHEWVASEWLRKRGFTERIIKAVENHVAAKKYLCCRDENYYHQLSDASKATLLFQGGIMSEYEAEEFEKKRFFKEMVLLRQWDDKAKEINAKTPHLQECLLIIEQYLSGKL